jgi:hypothetical protein
MEESIIKRNKELIEKYPFLKPRNRWTDEVPEDYDYSYTELDAFPEGWLIAFGNQMVEEIYQILLKADYVEKYRIMQIKEKYGSLRWYDGAIPVVISKELGAVINKYERLSYKTCIKCGEPAYGTTRGWITPYCEKCEDINNMFKF